MKRCRTCAHWVIEDNYEIVAPVDPDTWKPMEMPFQVGICRHPEQTFCERPVADPGFGLADGSGWAATLFTTADFGCVLHEEKT
jgi:hypothetical protein